MRNKSRPHTAFPYEMRYMRKLTQDFVNVLWMQEKENEKEKKACFGYDLSFKHIGT